MPTEIELRDRLFAHLHRGGGWAYYWTTPDKKSFWHPVGKNGNIPKGEAVYFGVHATGVKRGKTQRSRAVDVTIINCVFAEFDDKDFGDDHAKTLVHIKDLPLLPSAIIDSGGGYHCYWLLDQPFEISTPEDHARVDRIQKAWVALVGSDDGAKDLARVLRVPGTLNHKYKPARMVHFHNYTEDLYDLNDLEAISIATSSPASPTISTPAEELRTGSAYADAALNGEIQRVRSARVSTRNTTLNKAAYSLGQLVGTGLLDANQVQAALLLAATAAGLPEHEALATIKSGLTAGHAKPRQLHKDRIPKNSSSSDDKARTGEKPPATAPEPADIGQALRTRRLTYVGNAECLEVMHGEDLRHDHTRNKWFVWNTQRWLEDQTGHAWRYMLETIRARQAEIPNIEDDDAKKRFAKWVVTSENNIAAALDAASKLKSLASTIELFDCDPMLANAGNVTLDLLTVVARSNQKSDYITRRLGPDYDAAAMCPRWLRFLQEVFSGDQDLIAYIQRAVGYSLTGDIREQKLFLCYGSGANGKSVFLATVGKLLGEYAASRAFSTFDADEHNRVGEDLAGLKGTRFVSVIETNEDRRLNEARIKSLTGQDEISCRFLFGSFFSYRPTFKLWLAMNHKPTIHGIDRGIWRRIQLIPFTQSFEERPDKTLEAKLQAELSGILNWALEGLRAWHGQGLNPPEAVLRATKEYEEESDLVGQWMNDCTVRGTRMEMLAGDGYQSFKTWCESQGIKAMGQPTWSRRVKEHSIQAGKRTAKGVPYLGIGLLMPVQASREAM